MQTTFKKVPLKPSYAPGQNPNINMSSKPMNGAIQYPEFTTLADSYNNIKPLLPEATPISGLSSDKFGDIKGFDDNYYNNLYGQAEKRLSDRYFTGANNLKDNLKNQMNRRGLIGSGVEAGATTDLYKSFADELSDVNSNLLSTRAQNDFELSKTNRDFGLNLAELNKNIEIGNRDYGGRMAEVGLRGASDQQRAATDYGTKLFQSQIEAANSNQDQEAKILDSLTNILNSKVDDSQRTNTMADIQRILDQYFRG